MFSSISSFVLHNGLLEFKYRNSGVVDKQNIVNVYKGSIFTFRTKKDLTQGKGLILTSLEALDSVKNNITHWTPNIYGYAQYFNRSRHIVLGYSEKNLKQINTFYIDIDSTEISEYDILSVAYELGFLPTFIIKSNRGYQVYFVLETPAFITKHSDYKVIEVAKRISNNIRDYFIRNKIEVDKLCNHFGIARFPTEDNVVYFDKNNVYKFSEWLDWSIKEDDRVDSKKVKPEMFILKGSKEISQVDEKWFKLLLNSTKIKGTRDLLGRNNVLFTLALACYSSGITQEECEDKLVVFNNNLETPLKEKEYKRIINSAYSTKYTSANRTYILTLCRTWVCENIKSTDLFENQIWTKFKKKRSDRKRIHFTEWENDVLNYIEKIDEVYLEIKKKDIIEELKIPKRSLDIVLKNLKDKGLIFYKSTIGRFGGIKIALIKKVFINTIELVNKSKEKYINNLANFFDKTSSYILKAINRYSGKNIVVQKSLFEEDVGILLTG